MILHRLLLNPRFAPARQALGDPYKMHQLLTRLFAPKGTPCPKGWGLWRLEPEPSPEGLPVLMVQTELVPDWDRVESDYFIRVDQRDLKTWLNQERVQVGQRFRFRGLLQPTVKPARGGTGPAWASLHPGQVAAQQALLKRTGYTKRVAVMLPELQEGWLLRQGADHGFCLVPMAGDAFTPFDEPERYVSLSQNRSISGHQTKEGGCMIYANTVLVEGILEVTNVEAFLLCIKQGLGYGKVLGLGMISVMPVR